jgi:hypothetical protein
MDAAPTYRIGPSDFFTPGDLRADADTLNAQVGRVDAQVTGNEYVSPDFLDGWTAFIARWKAFYEDHWGGFFSSWLSAVNDSNRDQLIAFERDFGAWASRAASEGARIVDPIYAPSTGAGDTLGKHVDDQLKDLPSPGGLFSSAAILVVVLVLGYFAWKAS